MASIVEPKTVGGLKRVAYREEDFPSLRLSRVGRNIRRLGALLLVLLVVITLAMFFAPWVQTIRGEGSVIALDPMDRPQSVEAPIKGRIAMRGDGVQENAFVTRGQLLFRIEDQDSDLLERLRVRVSNFEGEVRAAEAVVEAAKRARTFAEQAVTASERGLESMMKAREDMIASAQAMVEKSKNDVLAAKEDRRAAEAKEFQTLEQKKRIELLYDRKIESELESQKATLDFQEAEAKLKAAEAKLAGAADAVLAKEKERDAKGRDMAAKIDKARAELEKARGDVQKAQADIDKAIAELASKNSKLLMERSKLSKQQTGEVRSPKDGYIMDLAVFEQGTIVKEGQRLCRIVPEMTEPAVQVWVLGNDAPLIARGDPVRLQFEGWPAVQFTGWPSVAVGTFGGKVQLVDATDNGAGMFRVVVVPDQNPNDEPWPRYPWLRQGVRANGWVLLRQVPLGYEIWRRMNGFPPSLKDAKDAGLGGPDKAPKPPKIKI